MYYNLANTTMCMLQVKLILSYKVWKFLKKLWCCVGGGNNVIWLYQLSWKCKLATITSYKADVLSVSPSSERMEELWVVCGFIWRVELRYWWKNSDEKNMNKLVEWKAFVDTFMYGIKSAIWKINFCSRVLRLSELPKCNEKPQIAICCLLEWLGKLKCLATGVDASLSFLS